MYAGHMPDGSSIQRHSAGALYPYVIFAKQVGDKLKYGVIRPDGSETLLATYDEAIAVADRCKNGTPLARCSR